MLTKMNPVLTPRARELRKKMTREECHLWYDYLHNYPIRYYRQRVLGRFIADFYCAGAKLVIEIDGAQHFTAESKQADSERTRYFEAFGLSVIRIPNYEVKKNFQSVCEYINEITIERYQKYSLR